MAEEETIGDVLSRVSELKKDEMTTEVESYGLEVHSSWTKDEIMEHFEEFLTTDGGDAVPEEAPEEDDTGAPPDEALPEQPGDADLDVSLRESKEAESIAPPVTSEVRIAESVAWGQDPGAYSP